MSVSSSPGLDALVTLPDGRDLAYAEWGESGGRPVIGLYGTPGSRLFCPDLQATTERGVRLITVDRPGYGRSSAAPDVTIASVAADLAVLHAVLGLPPCPVFGWSGGGPYALGAAAFAPRIVTVVGVAASWGPLRDVPGIWDAIPLEVRELMDLVAADRAAGLTDVQARCAWYAERPERVLDDPPIPGNPDDVLHRDPGVNTAMRTWFREGARQGTVGFVDDWIASYARLWGFELATIDHPVRLWWGDADVVCSREHTMHLLQSLPTATLEVYPGEGHLAPVNHWASILDRLLEG